jgi:DEAD/DEAH box helicase domain-containing protein
MAFLPATESGLLHSAVRELERRATEANCLTAVRYFPARDARFAAFPAWLDPRLTKMLEARGIAELYTHQAAVLDQVHAGKNVVVVTPTASGKTFCYTLPVLDTVLKERGARSIFLYPTKALARDQMEELNKMIGEMGEDGAGLKSFVYDGDTPQDARRAIRTQAQVVLTNPDMLHAGILPHHTKWAKLFQNLKYVVLDELHTYRGVFGSHLCNVLRRLKRVAAFYGANPQFICTSATIANPGDLARRLLEADVELVADNGAPAGEKFFLFYNPPVVNQQLGIRRSYVSETRQVALNFLARGLQTIVFANSRLITEILVTYLKDACEKTPHARFRRGGSPAPNIEGPGGIDVWQEQGGWTPDMVRGYRGGYLPEERRTIEKALREGFVRVVVATNALELGIDIGSLDVALLAGYPGTIASTWQRAGRAGRRSGTAAAVLIASSSPLDQFIIQNPDYFFGQSPEHAYIQPDNPEIMINHLKCGAFEIPLRDGEAFGGANMPELCQFLADTGFLHRSGAPPNSTWHWTNEAYPADAVSLRAVSSDNFVIIDTTDAATVIGEVDFPSALTTLHEKAIYLHEGRQHHVERFDYDQRKAYVKRVDVDYFTDAISNTRVTPLEEFAREPLTGGVDRVHGEIRVNTQVVGFKKIKFYTLENIGAGDLQMPEQQMHTTAYWLALGAEFMAALHPPGHSDDGTPYTAAERHSGVLALAAGLRGMATLLLMCDRRDIAWAVRDELSPAFAPDIFLFDAYPGGIGLSEPLFHLHHRLLEQTQKLIEGCQCEAGCPSCVGAPGNSGERGKEVALAILAALRERAQDSDRVKSNDHAA